MDLESDFNKLKYFFLLLHCVAIWLILENTPNSPNHTTTTTTYTHNNTTYAHSTLTIAPTGQTASSRHLSPIVTCMHPSFDSPHHDQSRMVRILTLCDTFFIILPISPARPTKLPTWSNWQKNEQKKLRVTFLSVNTQPHIHINFVVQILIYVYRIPD